MYGLLDVYIGAAVGIIGSAIMEQIEEMAKMSKLYRQVPKRTLKMQISAKKIAALVVTGRREG